MSSRFQWSPSTAALRAMVHGQSEVSVRFTPLSLDETVASWNVKQLRSGFMMESTGMAASAGPRRLPVIELGWASIPP